MSFTHALSTNRYGEADLIVSSDASQGTHTTLTSAMAAAVSGQTIFLRTSVTESVTLTAGVNIAAWFGGTLNVPSITGTLTMTAAGTCNISGIRLVTNSAALLAVTGSAASIVNLNDCYLNCSNNTGITFSTSSASAQINIKDCTGDLGTTGIALFSHSSAGTLNINYSNITNSGGSSTASTCSAGVCNISRSNLNSPFTLSGTAAGTFDYSLFATAATNSTSVTAGGSGVQSFRYCRFSSGTASAVSIGATAILDTCSVDSTNTNAVTGAGTLNASLLTFTNTSNTINTTTQTPHVNRVGVELSGTQPAFLATASLQSDVTGDGTAYTLLYANEIFDQNSNFASPNFTAPYTGRYQFNITTDVGGLGVANTAGNISFISSNRTVICNGCNWGVVMTVTNVVRMSAAILLDMDAADTCALQITISSGTKVVDIAATNTTFSGFLAC